MQTAPLFLLLMLLASGTVPPDIVEDRVDLIELNHFHDDAGRHVFDQVIFYDWSPSECRFQVRAWRMVHSLRQESAINGPQWRVQRDHAQDEWLASGRDGELLRRVTAAMYRESWTQHDPELLERDIFPKEQRRELSSPRPRP